MSGTEGHDGWAIAVVVCGTVAFALLLMVVARDVRSRDRARSGLADAMQRPSRAKAVLVVVLLLCAAATYYQGT